jgi:hypothetical protein
MKVFALGALVGLLLGGGLVVAVSATGLIKVPAPETCYLGYPNSGNGMVFEATGKGAWELCDDLTNPIRQINALKDARAIATNSWAQVRLCQFYKYGLTWTVYWSSQSLPAGYPDPCNGGF